jgi:hypothetical protein
MKTSTLYWLGGALVALAVLRRRPATPAGQPPGAESSDVFGMPDASIYTARPETLQDRYRSYLATTTSANPLPFDQWVLLQTGEAKDRIQAASM